MNTLNNFFNTVGTALTFTVVVLLASGCTPPPPNTKNSLAQIIALSLTINGTDYPANIQGIDVSALIPMSKTVPNQVTVKSITLTDGASGLTKNEQITLTDGKAQMTITAEDGTTADYSLIVAKRFTVTEVAKSNTSDIRWSYALFTVKSGDSRSVLGQHKLALKLSTEPAPTTEEMTSGAGIYRIINGTEKRMLLAYTLESVIGDTIAADSPYLRRIIKHNDAEDPNDASNTDTLEVDNLLLTTGQTYTLYALKNGATKVENLGDFSTDAFDDQATVTENTALDPALTGEYPLNDEDVTFVYPFSTSIASNEFAILSLGYSISSTTGFNFTSIVIHNSAIFQMMVFIKGTFIVPSQFIDGTNPFIIVGEKIVINGLLITSTDLSKGKVINFQKNNGRAHYTITTIIDQ